MYLYLSSQDSSGFHSSNKGSDFVITLPASYYFSRNECWEIGLIDIYLDSPKASKITRQDLNKVIHVCCDAVEPSGFNGSERQLLTTMRFKDCIRHFYTAKHIKYVALTQERLSSLHLYLNYSNGDSVSVEGLTTSCTLHVRRKGEL